MNYSKFTEVYLKGLISILILASAFMISCATGPIPKVNIKTWAGDSSRGAIRRSQDPDQISCTDPRFDSYACITYSDVRSLYDALQSCQGFAEGTPLMTEQEKKEFYTQNKPVLKRVEKGM